MEKTYYCPVCGCTVKKQRDGSFFCGGGGHIFDTEEELKPKTSAHKNAQTAAVVNPTNTRVPATTSSMDAEDVYEKNCRGVVEILTEVGRASGFLISKRGLVITNAHAVLDEHDKICSKVVVKHEGMSISAHVIAIGDTNNSDAHNVDLALLVMERVPADAVALKLGSSSKIKIGQHVYYIGNSKGEGLCMTAGIISDINRQVGERYFLMTDAATNPGNSGGPLFNVAGEVVGVHVSARQEAVGMKYSIPIDTVRLFLNVVEDKLQIPHDTVADNVGHSCCMSTESVSAGLVLTLVLSGISLLVKNIEYIQNIVQTIRGK